MLRWLRQRQRLLRRVKMLLRIGILIWIFIIIIGMLFFYCGFRDLHQAKESTTWPTAKGQIRSSSVKTLPSLSLKHGNSYYAEVMYYFTVNEKRFSGNLVTFGDRRSRNPSQARDIVKMYPDGEAVTVHYNPKNPQVCVLEPGVKGQVGIGIIFGPILMMLGIYGVFSLHKSLRAQSAAERNGVIEICPPQSVQCTSISTESDMDTSGCQTQHSERL
jgi:hypothetical protein